MSSSSTSSSTTTCRVQRSELPHLDSSNASHLTTIKGMRSAITDSLQTSEFPAIPFIVARFLVGVPGSPVCHLFPDEFPDIDKDIGHGASFVVQKATIQGKNNIDDTQVPFVALKRIRPDSPDKRQSFRSAVTDLICLAHPSLHQNDNIVTLLGLGWEASPSNSDSRLWPYLILEYTPFGTLADLQKRTKLTHEQKRTLCCDVASGLTAVHFANIVHGDVKSENILVFPKLNFSYTAKLTDFGYSILDIDFRMKPEGTKMDIDEVCSETRIVSGTYPWHAPEYQRVVSWEVAFKTDTYSWGLLVWRVHLDGKNPFDECEHQFRQRHDPSGHSKQECVRIWKEENSVLDVAQNFARSLENEESYRECALEQVFENSIQREPEKRDLQQAFLLWKHGTNEFEFEVYQLPLNRKMLYQPVSSFRARFRFYTLQSYPPRLRKQFLVDLKELANLESPVSESDSIWCPTIIATMLLAEYHISSNNLGFAYKYIEKAAKKGIGSALSLVSRLEPYKGYQMAPNEFQSSPLTLDIRKGQPSDQALKWTFEAACNGSVSALEQLKPYEEMHLNALRVLRRCELGGFRYFRLWTKSDASMHDSVDKTAVENMLKSGTSTLENRWLGPRIGVSISILHVACAKGVTQIVKTLISEGESINSHLSPGKETPLLLACMSGSLATVQILISYGADPRQHDENGETPLHWISAFDDEEVLIAARLLFKDQDQLTALADTSAKVHEGWTRKLAIASGTPLHRAVGKNSISAVKALLDLGSDPLAINGQGTTAMGLAAQFHLADILSLLHSRIPQYIPNQDHELNLRLFNFAINSGSPLQLFDIHGIYWRQEMERTIKMLLSFGEDLYGYDGEDNFIHNAIAIGDQRMVDVLLDNGGEEHMDKTVFAFLTYSALFSAMNFGRHHTFISLLNRGADIHKEFPSAKLRKTGTKFSLSNRPDRSTYLHICAELGTEAFFVREFLDRGIPVNQADANWHTAFYLALRNGYIDICSELMNRGANLGETRGGLTILGQIAYEGLNLPKERFQYLLELQPGNSIIKFLAGVRNRQSIFHLLAQEKQALRSPAWVRELLSFLLSQIKDSRLLDLQDVGLNSAVHFAVLSNNAETLRALLEKGACPSFTNFDGDTPLSLARRYRLRDIIQLLISFGAIEASERNTLAQRIDAAESSWDAMGFTEDKDWLDTAMLDMLEQLREKLLELFRIAGFLQRENPWKAVAKVIGEFLQTFGIIFNKPEWIADLNFALKEMLYPFVDAVITRLNDDGMLYINLVKPLNNKERKFPHGLQESRIKSISRVTEFGRTSYRSLTAEQGKTSSNAKDCDDSKSREEVARNMRFIRLRRLEQGHFLIEPHSNDIFARDPGIMVIGRGEGFVKELILEQLREAEKTIRIIDTTDEGISHVSTSLEQFASLIIKDPDELDKAVSQIKFATEQRPINQEKASQNKEQKEAACPTTSRKPPQGSSPSAIEPTRVPKVSQPTLSTKSKARLKILLGNLRPPHIIWHGDELEFLIFDTPIPENLAIKLHQTTTGNYLIALPQPDVRPRHIEEAGPEKSSWVVVDPAILRQYTCAINLTPSR